MRNVLLMTALLFAGTVFAETLQNNLQKKKANYYASEAVKYFNLEESQKATIYEAKVNLMQAQVKMAKIKKNGELATEDEKSYRKENLYPFNQKLMNELGVKWGELDKFNKKVNPTINKMRI